MTRSYFKHIEHLPCGTELALHEVVAQLNFNDQNLIPVITQDATSQKVLMLAWMNQTALALTLATRRVTYWSRSRQQLWVKGKTSGHTQSLVSIRIDCDGDTLLCHVNQTGGACHTGRNDCFYLHADINSKKIIVRGDSAKSSLRTASLTLV